MTATSPGAREQSSETASELEALRRECADARTLYEQLRDRLRDGREACARVRRVADELDGNDMTGTADAVREAEHAIRVALDGHGRSAAH